MVELGLFAGLRVIEMTRLRHCDINIDDSRSFLIAHGKGNKIRPVIIGMNLSLQILDFMKQKIKFGFSNRPNSYLLINQKDQQISRRYLQKSFKEAIKLIEIPNHYSIHCLRHTYATHLLKASNYNYRFVQKQLGHASIKTTQVYAGVLESEGKKALEKMYK